jgi:non-specific serine/threonine protein kinase
VQGRAAQQSGPSTGLDPLLEARVLAVGAGLATISGELGQVRSLVEAAGRLVEHHALEDHALTAAVRRAEGTVLFWDGDTEAGRRLLEAAVRTSASGGDRYGEALGVLALGMCLLHGGDRRGGEEALRDAVALGEAAGDVHVRSYALGLLALGAAETGDWATADSAARETLGMRAALGDDFGVSFALELLGCASAHRGEAERAAVLFGAAETWRRAVGLAAQTVAGLEELRGTGRTTARTALGARRFDAEVRRGHDLTKEQSIRFARDGEPLDGVGARSAAAEPAEDDVPLTPREAEVAQLVGQGMSNREIAEKLVISHRTAQGHVEHILRKLGFTSRSQVAAWVAERQARSMLR